MNARRTCPDCGTIVSEHATHCRKHSSPHRSVGKQCRVCGVRIWNKHTTCEAHRRRYNKPAERAKQQDPLHAGSIAAQMDAIIAEELKMPWERKQRTQWTPNSPNC